MNTDNSSVLYRQSSCPIWGTPSTVEPTDRDGQLANSPRAGGAYLISGTARTVLSKLDDIVKARLTTWLVRQRQDGTLCPEFMSDMIGEVSQWEDVDVSDRVDNVLRYLAAKLTVLGSQLDFRFSFDLYDSTQPDAWDFHYFELLAHSGCVGHRDFEFLLEYLRRQSLIEGYGISNREQACSLTVEAHTRLAELRKVNSSSSKAFLAMWFHPSMDDAYDNGFKSAVLRAGYEPIRIDKQEYVGKIDDQIISEIRRVRFVIADFTHGEEGPRGGVYYEAGFAYGLKVPVIFTCRKDYIDKLHFDTRQYNHIAWTTPEELRENLMNRISAVIGDGPLLRAH